MEDVPSNSKIIEIEDGNLLTPTKEIPILPCVANIPHKMGEAALNSINREISQLRKKQGFICRVMEPLRSVNSKAYEPNILAIGPYHHGKDEYKMMEEYKLRYLQSILERVGETTAERYISVVAECEEEARSCYAEPVDPSPDKFIKMLVLDGCFIIELAIKLRNSSNGCPTDLIFREHLISTSVIRDLILFENQIPFFILRKLFDLIEGPNQCNRLINLLLGFCERLFPDQDYRKSKDRNPSDAKHLLDLTYSCWTPESFDGAAEAIFIPSATELNDANVKFKKSEQCNSLFEVKFHNGTLFIPPLMIEDQTDCFLRNLLVYEQYFRLEGGNNLVVAYVKFMDLLINSSKDVDILEKCGIINSLMGEHDVIVNMFNKLGDCIIVNSKHAYGKTFNGINTYRTKPWNRWMIVLKRDYFSTPWGFISIFAASVLLILTIIQTVCSILQVFEEK